MNSTAEQVIVDILRTELGLADPNIWVMHQNRLIPETDDLFIVVGMVDSQIMNVVNSSELVTVTQNPPADPYESLREVQQVGVRENIQIDIMSRNDDARMRRWEVLAALSSIYSVQKQEEQDFKIFAIPRTFVNSSGAEGGSTINRFTIIVSCMVLYTKKKAISGGYDYYNDFDTRADTEKTIENPQGIVEFNISES